MPTLAEIEAAVLELPPADLHQLREFVRSLPDQPLDDAELAAVALRNGFRPLPRRNTAVNTTEDVLKVREAEGI